MNSPVKFLRHKRGNGKIYGNGEALNSILDKFSTIEGNSSVFDSHIYHSEIEDSNVSRCEIKNSTVKNSVIFGSIIENCLTACELIATLGELKDSMILENTRITERASLFNVRLKNLTVFGDAVLINWNSEVFDGRKGYISSGIWDRPPRVLRVGDLTITESTERRAFCGCYEKPIAEWLRIGAKIGKVFGVTEMEVQEIREFLISL